MCIRDSCGPVCAAKVFRAAVKISYILSTICLLYTSYALQPDEELVTVAAEEHVVYNTIPQLEKAIAKTKKQMQQAARDLDFMEAARLRDEMFKMQQELETMKK